MNFMQETRAADAETALEHAARRCAELERQLEQARREYEYHRRHARRNGGQATLC